MKFNDENIPCANYFSGFGKAFTSTSKTPSTRYEAIDNNILINLLVHAAQQCGVTNLPSFSNPGNNAPRIQYRQQVLIPSYQFNCCGVVNGWGAYVEPGGGNDEMNYNAIFQVWRPEGNGVYTIVGENAYPKPITLAGHSRLIVIATEPLIQFQPGDVVGYYLDSDREVGNGVQLDESDTNQEVYYGPPQGNTFNTRADGVEEENRAPILLVRVG